MGRKSDIQKHLKAVGHRKIRGTNWSQHAHYNHVHVNLSKEALARLENAMLGDTYKDRADEVLPEPTWTYRTLEEELYHKGNGNIMDKRKVGNNTWLLRDAERVHVRLHNTNILTYTADNRVILNSGGWETVTTKDRMNSFLGWGTIQSERSVWYVHARFWLSPRGIHDRGRYVEARVPFSSFMALDVRTHELVEHPDAQFIDINNSLVMREASDLSSLISVHSQLLERKVEDGSLTRDDLSTAARILERYQDEHRQVLSRVKSLESSLSWAASRLEDVLEQAMKHHAEVNYEHKERLREVKGQDRFDVYGEPRL